MQEVEQMDFEKLGLFYLGRPHDPAKLSEKKNDDYLLYQSKDLTTHAVCIGMTGSGKTGLCIGLLEEAAIDGIPSIIIDPKGDMANLMLSFPQMAADDFLPWINQDEAARKGMDVAEFAAHEARRWREGLAAWDQDPARIKAMRATTDFTVFTPGSSAGAQLSILQSFQAPAQAVLDDQELLHEQVRSVVSSLLSLVGLESDPVQSKDHILLAHILLASWQEGKDLDLADLISLIQQPPMQKIGVMDLDPFYPAKERFNLALRFNNLLASPGFSLWLEGEPLDVDSLLYLPSGKPRLSIMSIAHLNDAERMFFVTLLLNQIVSWTRSQTGTGSLRAILYMDEIFGYFPPVANPPSKEPLLTLLKQARAYGLGIMLTTQNPVDLDYKGLANAGTWFIGRLQTERDRLRVIDGLAGAAAGQGLPFDKAATERLIAGLGQRIFLLHNVHEKETVLFETRWCLSYLRGPLTRAQIQQLDQGGQKVMPQPLAQARPEAALPQETVRPAESAGASEAAEQAAAPPAVPASVRTAYLPVRGQAGGIIYRPYVLGMVQVGYSNNKYNIHHSEDKVVATALTDGIYPVNWDQAMELELDLADLATEGVRESSFTDLPEAATVAKNYTAWKKDLQDWAYRTCRLELLQSSTADLVARPDEDERDFRIRLQQKTRETRDAELEKLQSKYASRIQTLTERIRKAEQTVEKEQEQARQQKMQTAISFGTTVLSAFLGKKAVSAGTLGRATTAARGVSRSTKEAKDVERAKENVSVYQAQLDDLAAQLEKEADQLAEAHDPLKQELDKFIIQPFKKDIQAPDLVLVWLPFRQDNAFNWQPAWK